VLVPLVAAAWAVAAAGQENTPNYYPMKVGTKWTYRLNANGQLEQLGATIARTEKVNDKELYRLESSVGGKVTMSENLSSSAEGVFRHRANGVDATPPICVIKYPVKKGEKWDTDTTLGANKFKISSTVTGEEDVEVPAGKYKTVTVEVNSEAAGMKFTTKYWFAADVGIVKQVATIGGNTISLELEKYEPAK
jgi:hypothetical protein